MNIDILQVISAAVMVAVFAVSLRDIKKEYALILSVTGAILLTIWGIGKIEPVTQKITELTQLSGIDEEYSEILLKALGISVSARLGHDICCDAGESAIAAKVDLCGRISLLLISLPLFERLINIAGDILRA